MNNSGHISNLAPSPMRENMMLQKEPTLHMEKDIHVLVENKEKCNPCNDNGYMGGNGAWKGLLTAIVALIVLTILFWLIYYSLKPPFVLVSGSNEVDTAKVLLAAFITAIIIVIVIWIFKLAIGRW